MFNEKSIEEQREELLPSLETNEKNEEIVMDVKIKRDKGYLYYLSSEGKLVRKKRAKRGKNKTPKIKEKLTNVNINVPKVMLNGYVHYGFKRVGRASKNSGYIWFPKELIGKEFKVILIPKDEWIMSQ